MQLVAVAGFKGGTAKTTTTVGIALHARQAGLDILVIDGDPQRSAWVWLTDHPEDDIAVERLTTRRAKHEIAALAADHDLVVVDTPPGETDSTITLAAMAAADLVVVPVAPTALDAERLIHTIDTAAAVCPLVAAVVVRTDPRWRQYRSLTAALQDDPSVRLLDSFVPNRQDIAAAALERPSAHLHWYRPVWDEITQLLKERH